MTTPAVSFIVPCYKLAHLLSKCVNSILAQSYGNFELIIMDDCSPDNTREIAQSFQDRRIRYIRNTNNLGHLRNYNKGIASAQGRYVWLISADDYLRVTYILQRYVDLLDGNPTIGYTFCAGYSVQDGRESQVIGQYPVRMDRDRIIPGHVMLKKLLQWNFVLSASGLVRRECYEKLSVFPLDMPWAGDWYLWCLFALFYDVGYFSEPMVCYRDHSLSMTTKLTHESLKACAIEDVAIPWIIRKKAREAGYTRLEKDLLPGIAHTYARVIASARFRESSIMTIEQFESELSSNITDESERNTVRAFAYADIGDEYYSAGYTALAKEFYKAAAKTDPWMGSIYAKRFLFSLGNAGGYLRRWFSRSLK